MVGKNPHRPEGKADADNEHMKVRALQRRAAQDVPPAKEIDEQNLDLKDRRGGPGVVPEEYHVGGSRPGVPSRVKAAIEERESE